MGVVLDLTARAVSFVSLIQDVLVQSNPLQPFPDGQKVLILDMHPTIIIKKIKSLHPRQMMYQQRMIELIWVSQNTPDKVEVQKEFYNRALMLLVWLQDNQKPLRKKLSHYVSLSSAEPGEGVLPSLLQEHLHIAPTPHQWREAIRSYLYEHPKARIPLAKALKYLPLLIVLALGGHKHKNKNQRLLQEWSTSENTSDKLHSRNENALLKNWWHSDTDRKAEKLLVNEMLILRILRFRNIPVPFELIYHEELQEVATSRLHRTQEPVVNSPQDPLLRAKAMQLRGLCLSGGGIRSATFNLGLLQGLAAHEILQKMDYFSSVSGGGYISTWLAAWVKRAGSLTKVSNRLNPNISKDPRGDEVRPLRWLRMYSNYLTPNSSIMSTDSWTLGMTWLRNTILNQLIILLLLCTLLLAGVFFIWGWKSLSWTDSRPETVLLYSSFLLLPGVLLSGWGMHNYNRPTFPPSPFKPTHARLLTNLLLATALVDAFLISGWLYPDEKAGCFEGFTITDRFLLLAPAGLVSWLGLIIVAILGRYDECFPPYESPNKLIKKSFAWIGLIIFSVIASAIGTTLLAFIWEIFSNIPDLKYLSYVKKFVPSGSSIDKLSRVGFVVGVPLVLEVISFTVISRMALMGDLFPDERREWWGRLGARLHRLAILWILVTAAVLFGVIIINYFLKMDFRPDKLKTEIAAVSSWIALVGAGVKLAFSSKVNGETKPTSLLTTLLDNFVRFAPYIFLLGFLLIAANFIYWVLGHPWLDFSSKRIIETPLSWLTVLFLSSSFITFLISWRVGVNEFSMHHFYRNRLVRAYLGASRRQPDRERTSNSFTGFDKEDDLKLSTLTTNNGYYGPYPIINATLNATYMGDLDRQDRKAESFVFTPLYCGFDIARTRASANFAGQTYDYGYRPTKQYAYNQGPSVGTAIAISGAAANPNMGHHSSSATAFLLTAFNVRLGWWIGNPRRNTWKRSDPWIGLPYVISDLVGRTSTHDRFVCLSDGGHFDNMGLYELIRRRCSLIIIGDAEQDDLLACQGLANAIRRCRIDFGVEINLDLSLITACSPNTKHSAQHFAIGSVRYPGDSVSTPSGALVYIKATLTGDEPVDLREYAISNPKFPHQTTGDQFFNESQFESYRRLGLHIIEDVIQNPQVRKILNTH